MLDIITRAKSNCIAFEAPPICVKRSKGRPAKKGKSVKLQTLFETHQAQFIEKSIFLYGEEETVSYYCTDLLWGAKLYQKLRFVLVKSSRGNGIFVCTNLNADPVMIIEAYGHRFKIELLFREFKQQIGGFKLSLLD